MADSKRIFDIWERNVPEHLKLLREDVFDRLNDWTNYLENLAHEADYQHLSSTHGGNDSRYTYQSRKTLEVITFGYEFEYEGRNGEVNPNPLKTMFIITDRTLLNRYRKTKHAEKLYAAYNKLIDAIHEEKERREIVEKLTN